MQRSEVLWSDPEKPPNSDSDIDTDNDEELKARGNRAYVKKKYAQAVKLYSKAIKLKPGNPTYYLNRAVANGALDLWKGAEADAQKAIDLANEDPIASPNVKAHFHVARAKLRQERLEEAMAAVQESLKLFPEEKMLLQLQREAEVALQKAKKKRQEEEQRKKIQEEGDQHRREHGSRTLALHAEGKALHVRGDLDGAFTKLSLVTAPGSVWPPGTRSEEMDAHALLGQTCTQLRKYPEAVAAFEAQLKIELEVFNSDSEADREKLAYTYNKLGIAYKNAKRLDEAITVFYKGYHKIADGDETCATEHASQTLQNIGQCLRALKKNDEAIAVYQRALDIDMRLLGHDHSSLGLHFLCLARSYRAASRTEEAIKMYSRAVELWKGKDEDMYIKEMPAAPSKDRLLQIQQQAQDELAELVH
eukprot:gnl/MRDRNA2_/MRDRNA2_159268_c0_seq1.p1 gnl/MRDRNA2_/MRDRNA2_159268_c0~~gnl/MRDRNA2_/MRDRNA2_159268_c0_seq1.p1  ORF type:complete len:419 (+),score=129.94 gnl/MRDRNA2_/MRDRNA2_159268_c0_seq1:101-1357(+)